MLLTPSRTGQPPLDQCYVFQIMLVGVASDVTPQGHTFRPGKALGVDQIFFAGGLYGLFNLRVGAAEIDQVPFTPGVVICASSRGASVFSSAAYPVRMASSKPVLFTCSFMEGSPFRLSIARKAGIIDPD